MNSDFLQELITDREVFFQAGDDLVRCTAVMPMQDPAKDPLQECGDTTDVVIFDNGTHLPIEIVEISQLFVCDGGDAVPLQSVLV